MYTRNEPPCGYCLMAKTLLGHHGIDFNEAVIPKPEGGSEAGESGDTAEGAAEPEVVEDKQEQLSEPGGGGGETKRADINQQYRDNFRAKPAGGQGFGGG